MSDTEREIPAEYVPTADQRALVENAAAFGLTQADSAEQLKIDEKTLRKHFQDELSSGKFKVDMTAGNVKKVWLLPVAEVCPITLSSASRRNRISRC